MGTTRLVVMIVVLATPSCGGETPTDASDGDPARGAPFTITQGGRTLSGQLRGIRVPESRRAPSGDSIELSYVLLDGPAAGAGVPHVYLAGGPGDALIDEVRGDLFDYLSAVVEVSPVVLLDQRGIGRSIPSTECGRSFDLPRAETDWTVVAAALRMQFAACVASVRDSGVDLAAYNTEESADDIEAVRRDLGADRIVLDGYSYGTHLALAYARRQESRVERMVLHGVEGPDHTWKLPDDVQRHLMAIDSVVAEDAAANEALGGFLSYVTELLAALDESPRMVDVDGEMVALDGFGVRVLLANLVGDRDGIRFLVGALAASRTGDWSALGNAMRSLKTLEMFSAMTMAMDCASNASAGRRERIESQASTTLLGDAMNFPFPEICVEVGSPDLGAAFRAPLSSSIPTLFISGTLDGRTPVSNAEEVAAGFSDAHHIIVDGGGHDALDAEVPGLLAELQRFLRGESLGRVTLSLEPIRFGLSPSRGSGR